ncbi:hypothetical protein Fot_16501 [Forsythia ovata]|uniref:Uncharacterized protein n=1 Tax=Forsythia ovata TaxID=205694 RepID=A0ABD1WEK7_9LAMI
MTSTMENLVNEKSKDQTLQSSFRFTPTLGVSIPGAEKVVSSGPSAFVPTLVAVRVVTEEVNISSMVEELQEIDAQEVATERALRVQRERMMKISRALRSTA